jgi:uncharacterized membrane protein
MGDFQASMTINVSEQALFDYLSQIANLPKYFARVTEAEPADGDAVRTAARLPDGQEVRGEAWFRTDADTRRIEWGSEGSNDYHGSLTVRATGGTEVAVQLHTTRVPDGDSEVQRALEETLANIKRLAEEGNPGQ